VTSLLSALLGRAMMLLAEGLPVSLVPEELLSFRYLVLLAAIDGLFQSVRLDVVNYSCFHCSSLTMTHDA